MKSKIYKSLATHLLKGQALGIKEIDLFKNQLSSSEDYLPQTYPAVLIEFGQVVWKQLDEEGEQRGEMEVTLHVLQRNERSTMGEFINIQENNFTFLDLPEKITTRMYLYKGENTEDLRRTSEGLHQNTCKTSRNVQVFCGR